MSRHAIYDAATGRIVHMVRGSAATVAANTPEGCAALEESVDDPIDPARDRIDVSVPPARAPRPPLALDPDCTLAQLAALDLPEDGVIVIGGEAGGVLAPGDLAAFVAARDGLDPISTSLMVEVFPFAPHVGTIVI